MSQVIGQIALELGVNSHEFKRQLLSLGKTVKTETNLMTGMFGKLGTAVAGALAIGKVIDFSKACIELGSDLTEVQNVVDVTYGSMSNKVNEFAKNAMESYGLSEKVAKQYMGTFGAMSKAFGYTTDAAYEQAAALTGLAGDVASFYNLTTDEAYTKLKSVFTGETESLKDLGVVMTQTALDEYALQKGIGKTTSEMSEQEKVALRLSFVQDRLATASGDFARTSDGWANQTRVLTLRFDALKATLGQGFINVLTPLLGTINDILSGLQRLADAFYDITVKIFGDAAAGGSSAALAGVAVATGDITGEMLDATKTAKALKKMLAGFDELNLIGSSSNDEGSSPAGTGTGSGAMPSVGSFGGGASGSGYDTSAIQETLTEITAIVGVATLALGAILTFTGANIPLGIGLMLLGAGELAAAVAMNWGAVTTQVASTLDLITTIVSGSLLVIGALLCLSGVKIPLGITLMAIGAVGFASVAATNWEATTNEVKLAITGIMTAVSTALLVLGAVLAFSGPFSGLGIALLAAGAVGLVSVVALNWDSMVGSVDSTVTTIAAIVGGALIGLGAVLAFSGAFIGLGIALMAAGAVTLAAAIVPNWSTMSEETKNTVTLITAIVSGALLALGVILLCCGVIPLGLALTAAGAASLAAAVVPNWGAISDETKKTITLIAAIAGGAMLALGVILCCCGIIPLGIGLLALGAASLGAAIAPNWNSIVNAVKNICDKIGGFFESLFKGIGNFFIDLLNGIISGINFFVDLINKIPGVDIKRVGKVPRLASGGYVKANTPQLAIIGDNKREGEIVAPESKIAEAVATGVASAFRQFVGLINNNGGSKQPTQIVIKIGEDEFWSGFIDYHNSVVKRTGDSPLLI